MKRKTVTTLILFVMLLLISGAGGFYGFVMQRNDIGDLETKLQNLKKVNYNPEESMMILEELKKESVAQDSLLQAGKYSIPSTPGQLDFFDFVDNIARYFSSKSYVDIEFVDHKEHEKYDSFRYDLKGIAFFSDLFRLVYAIEQSRNLKKIAALQISDMLKVGKTGKPLYMVTFSMIVEVIFTKDEILGSKEIAENDLKPERIRNLFYPLIRNEIPPNSQQLLDTHSARLLALVPDGAFLTDVSGRAFLLTEGDNVYLGLLTKINFEKQTVKFVLNKGGIVEKFELGIESDKQE